MDTLTAIRQVSHQWLSPLSRMLVRQELKQLPRVIWSSEKVMCMIQGWYEMGICLLVATDKRLIMIDKKPFDLKVDGFSYSRIEAVEFDRAVFAGRVTITMPGSKIDMRWVNPRAVRSFSQYVSNCVAHTAPVYRGKNFNPRQQDKYPAPASDSNIELLERLSKLYRMGILTRQEFQIQKTRILGLGDEPAVTAEAEAEVALAQNTRPADTSSAPFSDFALPDERASSSK